MYVCMYVNLLVCVYENKYIYVCMYCMYVFKCLYDSLYIHMYIQYVRCK